MAASDGQRIQATAASAVNFAGGQASMWGGAAVGAQLGLYGGPLAEFTVPIGAFAGGVAGVFGWDAAATPIIRKLGYETPQEREKRYEWQLEQLKNRRPGHE